MPPFFDDAAVRRLLSIHALIETIEQTLIDVSAGKVIQPPRTVYEIPSLNPAEEALPGLLFTKPVITPEVIVTKIITQLPGNPARGLPTMMATLLLMDRATGQIQGVMDATWLTNLRTAAVSAVAVRKLMPHRPLKVALIGSGALARTHALALRCVRNVLEMRVWSRSSANAAACAAEVGGLACGSAEQAVEGADVIVTVTLSPTPVVQGAWLKPGALVCAIGAPRPNWRELDDAAMHAGVVIGDSYHSARHEAGDVLLSGATVSAEIGEVLAGSKVIAPGTTMVFKALGLAAEDAAAAQLVLRMAASRST